MQLCDVYISLPNSFKQHIALIISLRHYLFTNSRGGKELKVSLRCLFIPWMHGICFQTPKYLKHLTKT